MKDETLIGLRAIKDTVKHSGGVTKVTISLEMVRAAEKSHTFYKDHLEQEKMKSDVKVKSNEERKRKQEEMDEEESSLYKKLQDYKEKEKAAQEKLERGMNKAKEGNAKVDAGIKANNMLEIEDGKNSIDLGLRSQNEARKELSEIALEKEKVESQLFKPKKGKKSKT